MLGVFTVSKFSSRGQRDWGASRLSARRVAHIVQSPEINRAVGPLKDPLGSVVLAVPFAWLGMGCCSPYHADYAP